ncbi:MAG: hypothetical protein GY696_13040, partial [Gammaproteobacteria bacterium]|nr:hypothetical protein [Gammaproteobacteria bacterium]
MTCHQEAGDNMEGQSSSSGTLVADSVYYPLEIEGVHTSAPALVDSGSTISIASLGLILKVAAVGDRKELLSRCRKFTSQIAGYGGRPLSDLRVCLPLKVRCRGAVEVTLLCAVDEG